MEFKQEEYLTIFKTEGVCSSLKYLSDTVPSVLYKFYSLETHKDDKLKTLRENKIWVQTFKNQNDPFEMINLLVEKGSAKDKYTKNGALLADKKMVINSDQKWLDIYRNSLKFVSFTQTMETNISMWAYYASNHKGFCCEYEIVDFSPMAMRTIKPVLYMKGMHKVTSGFVEYLRSDPLNSAFVPRKEMEIRNLTREECIKILASCKDPSWSHEKEYRAFYEYDDSLDGESVDCSILNLRIKAIYLGIEISKDNESELIKISQKLNVPIYRMLISEDSYSLIPEKIG